MSPFLVTSLFRFSRRAAFSALLLPLFILCIQAAASAQTVRINAGGKAYTDSLGRSWSADAFYSGGTVSSTAASISNTNDDVLYQSERYGNFVYKIRVAPGSYVVTLHFAELRYTSTGKRVFDVSAENRLMIDNLDIFAKAGALQPYRYSFTTNVTDGTLNLNFKSVIDRAKVSAIEVEPADLVVTPASLDLGSVDLGSTSPARSITVQNRAASAMTINSVGLFGADAASFKITGQFPATIGSGASLSIPVTFTPAHDGTSAATVEIVPQSPLQSKSVSLTGTGIKPISTSGAMLVNSGGNAFIDSSGRQWSGDTGYSSGSYAYSTAKTITGTTNQALYQTERYGSNFTYRLNLQNGTYQVVLHFAEIYFSTSGSRVFDVYAENNLAISKLDIVAAAGALKPLTRTITVQVADGALDLKFVAQADNAKISGIEVNTSSGPVPTPTPTPNPTATPVPTATPAPTPGTCANLNKAGVIFCDDFETELGNRYFEYDNAGGRFVRVPNSGVNGSYAMRATWQPGDVGAGSIKRSFGRVPAGIYYGSQSNSTQDFRDIYWRLYVRTEPGWTGNPDKLSRAMIFGSETSWAEAMIAHVWTSHYEPQLLIDPASGIDSNNNLATTTYNDFANLRWLGAARSTTPIFSAENAGKWYCVEAHAKLNTPGSSDAVFEMWINGNLEASKRNFNWVGTWQKYGINSIFVENYWNEGAPGQRIRYLDNLVISTQPIGCN